MLNNYLARRDVFVLIRGGMRSAAAFISSGGLLQHA
jgi:hypothetical protein